MPSAKSTMLSSVSKAGMRGMLGVPGFPVGGGYTDEIAACNEAVQYDGVVFVAAVPTQVADPKVPPLLLVNDTLPVGGLPPPCVATVAVNVTVCPEVTDDKLLTNVVLVGTCVTVMVSVLLELVAP